MAVLWGTPQELRNGMEDLSRRKKGGQGRHRIPTLVFRKEQERDQLNISRKGRKPGTIIGDFDYWSTHWDRKWLFFFHQQQEEASVGQLFQRWDVIIALIPPPRATQLGTDELLCSWMQSWWCFFRKWEEMGKGPSTLSLFLTSREEQPDNLKIGW